MARPSRIRCSSFWPSRLLAPARARCCSNATTPFPRWQSWCARCGACARFTTPASGPSVRTMQQALEGVFAELLLGPTPTRAALGQLSARHGLDEPDATALSESFERLLV